MKHTPRWARSSICVTARRRRVYDGDGSGPVGQGDWRVMLRRFPCPSVDRSIRNGQAPVAEWYARRESNPFLRLNRRSLYRMSVVPYRCARSTSTRWLFRAPDRRPGPRDFLESPLSYGHIELGHHHAGCRTGCRVVLSRAGRPRSHRRSQPDARVDASGVRDAGPWPRYRVPTTGRARRVCFSCDQV